MTKSALALGLDQRPNALDSLLGAAEKRIMQVPVYTGLKILALINSRPDEFRMSSWRPFQISYSNFHGVYDLSFGRAFWS